MTRKRKPIKIKGLAVGERLNLCWAWIAGWTAARLASVEFEEEGKTE